MGRIIKITNIQWDIEMEDVLDRIFGMKHKTAAEILGVPADTYADMTGNERYDLVYDVFYDSIEKRAELMGLPKEIEISEEDIEENLDAEEDCYLLEEIEDTVSDKYGWCFEEFNYEILGDKEVRTCP